MKIHKQIAAFAAITGIITLTFGGAASAHVTVTPAEALTASRQTFSVNVPNEKDVPTTQIKLVVPSGLTSVMPFQKTGWEITTETTGSGEEVSVTSITWKGGQVNKGMREAFAFGAKAPAKATELQWKAYQTYADGSVVAWDKAEVKEGHSDGPNSGPFSVTKVAAETEADARVAKAEQAAADAKSAANRGTYLGIAGVAVGLFGVFLATRKKQ